MDSLYYLGLDVHKKAISYCLKQSDGQIVREGDRIEIYRPLQVDPKQARRLRAGSGRR